MERPRPDIDNVREAMRELVRERDRQRSEEAGFLFHLVKPVDFDELASALHRAVAALA